jgi:3-oxoacyl-[acyl-carrier-protein] synthase II
METATRVRPCITSWSTISPIGIGRQNFSSAFLESRIGIRAVQGLPIRAAGAVTEFKTQEFLGVKNTRSFDRLTGLAVATAVMVLEDSGAILDEDADPIAVVLGTTTGSVASISDFTRETLVQKKPFYVNPALFPNTVINCAAGQTAIWCRLKGANTTVSGGYLTGLLSLQYAARTMRRGYSATTLVGSAEELCAHRAWADFLLRSAARRKALPIGEGCVFFLLERFDIAERADRQVLAELIGLEFGVQKRGTPSDPRGLREALSGCVRRLLRHVEVRAEDVWAVSLAQCGDEQANEAERDAIGISLGKKAPEFVFTISELIGDTFSAAAAFQVAAVLVNADTSAEYRGRLALVTAFGVDGDVGCALIRT